MRFLRICLHLAVVWARFGVWKVPGTPGPIGTFPASYGPKRQSKTAQWFTGYKIKRAGTSEHTLKSTTLARRTFHIHFFKRCLFLPFLVIVPSFLLSPSLFSLAIAGRLWPVSLLLLLWVRVRLNQACTWKEASVRYDSFWKQPDVPANSCDSAPIPNPRP